MWACHVIEQGHVQRDITANPKRFTKLNNTSACTSACTIPVQALVTIPVTIPVPTCRPVSMTGRRARCPVRHLSGSLLTGSMACSGHAAIIEPVARVV
jgi:hypothetical protein